MAKLGIGLILAAMLAGPAAAQTITKAQIRSQPPEITAQQLQGQLWGIFQPQDMRSVDPAWPPRNMLEDIEMTTRPYPIADGLCRRDTMQMRFLPAPPVAREKTDANTPVRAYGIDVWQGYRLVEPEEEPWADSDWMERGWEICARQGGEHFIGAPNDTVAKGALYALHRGTAGVASGRLTPGCRSRYREGYTCQMAYESTVGNKPLFVNECDLGVDNFHPRTCFTAQYPHNMLIFRGTNPFSASGIVSVEIYSNGIIDDSGLRTD